MASSGRSSNGRSPLVNPQRQITSFFSKFSSSSISSSPSPSSVQSKRKPSANPSATQSPITPSPLNPKRQKSLLVVGDGDAARSLSPTPETERQSYCEEVVGKKIKVYWPLDKSWYEGCVKSFDNKGGKHVVVYDDGEEESLDLSNEKIEWIQETEKKLKRLRRVSFDYKGTWTAKDELFRKMEFEGEKDETGVGDDSSGEDWGKSKVMEDDEDTDVELEDKEEEENGTEKRKRSYGSKVATKKRKGTRLEELESAEKSKAKIDASNGVFKAARKESSTLSERKC